MMSSDFDCLFQQPQLGSAKPIGDEGKYIYFFIWTHVYMNKGWEDHSIIPLLGIVRQIEVWVWFFFFNKSIIN